MAEMARAYCWRRWYGVGIVCFLPYEKGGYEVGLCLVVLRGAQNEIQKSGVFGLFSDARSIFFQIGGWDESGFTDGWLATFWWFCGYGKSLWARRLGTVTCLGLLCN